MHHCWARPEVTAAGSTAVTTQGTPFLWPIKLPRDASRPDNWSRSALDAAERATRGWVRLQANLPLGAYDVWEAAGIAYEPQWPAEPLAQLIEVGFRGRLIDTLDHPVDRRLQGHA